ncbi:hypothetical protein BT63DRAFT_206171 [Microthyrium microscopicum]|uniref:Pleckstrin homology domain-containing protein n=1 Tax=Microthyrium microscopicum TaxID=703497 RepID=A0A6A6UJG2_9PEZI|nr:hypothetical protein BT63DRAFT_206171 [Microthyrium microscopicum]
MVGTSDYFSELEAVGSNSSTVTPSLSGSVYHTPRASMSRRSSAKRDISRGASSSPTHDQTSSPPPLPTSSPGTNTTHHDDTANDEDISPLDPRRFTPTLHANLVSEILNLRRELDSKHKFIEDLETSLHATRNEKDDIEDKFAHAEKERRNLKRQFQQLENSTLGAVEELANDRDEVKRTCTDLKQKLEESQEKNKRQDEESNRTHAAWEKDQTAWEAERRAYERRVHITETRLKQVLIELEAVHQAHSQAQEHPISEEDDHTRDSGLGDESDTASQASPMRNASHRRTMSNSSRLSYNRYRFSVQSVAGVDGSKINGISLADELQLDEEDEDLGSEAGSENPHHESPERKGIVAKTSRFFEDKFNRPSSALNRRSLMTPIELDEPNTVEKTSAGALSEPFKLAVKYVDAGVQYDIPAPDVKEVQTKQVQTTSAYCDSGIQYEPMEFEDISTPPATTEQRKDSKVDHQLVNGLRQDISTPPLHVDRGQQMSPSPAPSKRVSMVSASSQTLDEPLSPPATPGVSPPSSPTAVVQIRLSPELKTTSTQTDFVEEPKAAFPLSGNRPAPIAIPSINIVPPLSAPSSPREPKLPPGTKNAFSQTTADLVSMCSVSVQTEEIRIDTRLAKLPPHLHPSAISSNPPTPDSKMGYAAQRTSARSSNLVDRSVLRSPSPDDDIPSSPPEVYSPTPTKQVGSRSSNDNLPQANDRVNGLRQLLRSSILGPAFDGDNDRSDREDSRNDHSDNEQKVSTFSTPNMSGRVLKHMRTLGGTRPSPVPEEKDELEHYQDDSLPVDVTSKSSNGTGRSSAENNVSGEKGKATVTPSVKSNSSKLRRSALIQSGAAAHRSRTPSVASVGSSSYFSNKSNGPPFPVPDRGSSRKLFPSRSEGSQSPTPRAGLFSSRRRGAPAITRKDSLRKVRSATVIHRSNSRGKSRSRSRSPPLLEGRRRSPVRQRSNHPPMPQDNVTVPVKVYPSQKSGEKRLSTRAMSPTSKPELSRASQGTVVDAIAATMVGEWMWKYVRRRTSFGVPESPQDQIGRPGTDGSVNVTGNGVRHKRWVWLSPYERAIMWSSKQPANNTALMGKSGRKLVIQSVLDVRDDTPLPKNHGIAEPFNRSILILTPARALKFTAMSRERHYTWLTALSFLAHSPLLAPGLTLPSVPPQEPEVAPPRSRGSGMKRGGIRDSVRIAKDRARPIKSARSEPQSGTIPEIEFEAAFGQTPIPPMPKIPDAAAEPPTVPRFAHSRNRSLTGPGRLPSSTLRSISPRDIPSPSLPISSIPSPSLDYSSTRVSEASTSVRSNFLDAVGTIRMEAFIDEQNNLTSYSPPLRKGGRRRGNTHSTEDSKRGGMFLGDDFELGGSGSIASGAFDPFHDFHR